MPADSHPHVPSPRPPARRTLATSTLLACAAFALSASCERIGFYSIGGRSSPSSTSPAETGGSANPTGSPPTTTRDAVLKTVAACTAARIEAFRAAADELEAAVAEAKADPAAQTNARSAWIKAMDLWQQAEVLQVGPAGPSSAPGGKALREHIYSWPLVSRCLVEQAIGSKAYEGADFGATALVNTRGLAAAEYLLFYEGADNACSPSTDINATGQWAALGPAEIAARKASYAAVVSSAVAARARELATAWSPEGGDFQSQLGDAGSGGSVYASSQAALNAVSDAMFYIESYVKDQKLARPLGLQGCEDATCPQAIEARFARRSKPNIRNNLVAYRMLMVGCDEAGGAGFRDLLAAVGASAAAEAMLAGVDEALAAEAAIKSDDLAEALVDDKAGVEALHAAVKKITDVLKTDFVSVLDLELPKTVEGDND